MRCFVWFLLWSIAFISASAAEDLQAILDRGTLRISICEIETPPFFYHKENGVYTKGIDIRLAEELAKDLGLRIAWIVKPTFDQVVQAVAEHEADIAISNLSITLNRAKRVAFTTPYIELKMAALVNYTNMERMEVQELNREAFNRKGVRVGFLADSSYEGYVLRLFPNAQNTGFRTWEEVIDALDHNKIDVAFYDDSNILTTIKAEPAISLRFKKVVFREAIDPIAIAVAPQQPELYLLMNQFINLRNAPIELEEAIDEYESFLHPPVPVAQKGFRASPMIFWVALALTAAGWIILIVCGTRQSRSLRPVIVQSLQNPGVIVASMVLGMIYGSVYRETGELLDLIGEIYFSILKMCSVPIMITAIIKSLGNVLGSAMGMRFIRRFIFLVLGTLLCASLLGLIGGVTVRPGVLSEETKARFGVQVQNATDQAQQANLYKLVRHLIPTNIVKAITEEDTLGLLFASILMGIALGVIGIPKEQKTLVFDTLFESFIQIINWAMYLLPFALFSLMAQQMAQAGMGLLGSMTKLIITFYVLCLLICALMVLILSHNLKMSPLNVLKNFRNAIVVAFSTASSFAAMPCAMNSLKRETMIDHNIIEMLVPLGVTIFRPGTILTLSLGTIFMAQLMGVSVVSDYRFLIIIFGCVFAGLSAAGAPAAVELSALAIFFPMLGLPFQVTMVVLLGVNTILDPIRTVTNILSNCALTSVMGSSSEGLSSPGEV